MAERMLFTFVMNKKKHFQTNSIPYHYFIYYTYTSTLSYVYTLEQRKPNQENSNAL